MSLPDESRQIKALSRPQDSPDARLGSVLLHDLLHPDVVYAQFPPTLTTPPSGEANHIFLV